MSGHSALADPGGPRRRRRRRRVPGIDLPAKDYWLGLLPSAA